MNYKDIDHFAYPLPFASELRKLGYKRAVWLHKHKKTQHIIRLVELMYSHPNFKGRKLFIEMDREIKSHTIAIQMVCSVIDKVQYFIDNPQQFGHDFRNVHLQILATMWRSLWEHYRFKDKRAKRIKE